MLCVATRAETNFDLTTAQTAERRWTEVAAMAIWHEQEQMMDIGG